MAVRQRGTSFQADFTLKGQRYRQDFSAEEGGAEAALAWEAETKSKIYKGETITPSNTPGVAKTLGELIEIVYNLKWRGNTKDAEKSYRNAQVIAEFIGINKPLSAVSERELDAVITAFKKQGNTTGTINRKLSSFSKCLKHAFTRGWINRVPHIERFRENESRIRYLTADEEVRVLSYIDTQDMPGMRDLVIFLVDTGMRISEALALRWKHLDGVWIRVGDTKANNNRSVPMTERVEKLLTERKQLHSENEEVFQDITYWNARTYWRKIRKHLKLDEDEQFVIHSLRHTFCSRLAQRGTPLLTIQKLAGHKTIQMTMRYSHLAPDNLLEAVRGLPSVELNIKKG